MSTAQSIMRIRCGCTATPEECSFSPDEIRDIVSHSALYRRLSATAQLGSVRLWPACGEAEKGAFCQAGAPFLFSDDSLNAGLAGELIAAKFEP